MPLKGRPHPLLIPEAALPGDLFDIASRVFQMPARLRAVLGDDAPIKVVVVDRGAQIAATLGDGICPAITEASAELGIEWRLGNSVAAADADGVELADGQRIEANTVIWTVGFRSSDLTEQIAVPRDAQGRLLEDPYLKVNGQAGWLKRGSQTPVPAAIVHE